MKRFLANVFMAECALSMNILQPIFNFGLRFYVAFVFFKSGLTKVDDKLQVTQTTKDLFTYEFKVPLLPPDVAAFLATYAELILPILLVLGLLSRPAAIALFILNTVAAISLAQTDFASAVGHWQHIAWGIIISVILAYGPSKLSIDSWISDRWKNKETNLLMKLAGIAVFAVIGYFLLDKYL